MKIKINKIKGLDAKAKCGGGGVNEMNSILRVTCVRMIPGRFFTRLTEIDRQAKKTVEDNRRVTSKRQEKIVWIHPSNEYTADMLNRILVICIYIYIYHISSVTDGAEHSTNIPLHSLTVATMVTAMKILIASSYCLMSRLSTADPSKSKMSGSLNCSRYFLYRGSCLGRNATKQNGCVLLLYCCTPYDP